MGRKQVETALLSKYEPLKIAVIASLFFLSLVHFKGCRFKDCLAG
jgi:hypothetical protein